MDKARQVRKLDRLLKSADIPHTAYEGAVYIPVGEDGEVINVVCFEGAYMIQRVIPVSDVKSARDAALVVRRLSDEAQAREEKRRRSQRQRREG